MRASRGAVIQRTILYFLVAFPRGNGICSSRRCPSRDRSLGKRSKYSAASLLALLGEFLADVGISEHGAIEARILAACQPSGFVFGNGSWSDSLPGKDAPVSFSESWGAYCGRLGWPGSAVPCAPSKLPFLSEKPRVGGLCQSLEHGHAILQPINRSISEVV